MIKKRIKNMTDLEDTIRNNQDAIFKNLLKELREKIVFYNSLKDELENAKKEYETRFNDIKVKSEQRIVMAELKAEAIKAGIINHNDLKILDLNSIKLDEKGDVIIPKDFFDSAKKERPYLFKISGAESGNTTITTPSPSPTNIKKKLSEMTKDEYEASKNNIIKAKSEQRIVMADSIDLFPVNFQVLIQQGCFKKEFEDGLKSNLGFRSVADKQFFPHRISSTITETRLGLLLPNTTPMNASANTGSDNGLSNSNNAYQIEQYSLHLDLYANTLDLNIKESAVELASRFLENAKRLGIQANRSIDRIARNTLFFGDTFTTTPTTNVGGYMGGNTRVNSALTANSTTLSVDDIRGFINVVSNVNNSIVPVSSLNTSIVNVNGNGYVLIGVTQDTSNVSTAPQGLSGTLTFATNVVMADGALNSPVVLSTAPFVIRSNNRLTTANLTSTDTLSFKDIVSATTQLRSNGVEPVMDNCYYCYLSDTQMGGLWKDEAFQRLYRSQANDTAIKSGKFITLQGVKFITTTEAPQQMLNGVKIQRAIVVGKGALIEGSLDLENLNTDYNNNNYNVVSVNGVKHIIRAPIDPLEEVVSQSYSWIGGFGLPTDITTNPNIIPTASNSSLKRAVIIESV